MSAAAPSPISETRERLAELAGNLRWTWNGEVDPLFRDLDLALWRRVNHNPTAFLAELGEEKIAARAADASYRRRLEEACRSLRAYLADARHWAGRHAPALATRPVAYFSAEFGLHESLPIYSGGLGVLAGDHLKSCSDLGVPIWGVGILYRQGYFAQRIDGDGAQEERDADLDLRRVPLEPLSDDHGGRMSIQLQAPHGPMALDLWQARIGRTRLLLLDAAAGPGAPPHLSGMRLYGGDQETRLLHELILGVGGYRALLSLGVRPGVLHLNEGHSAFALLEAVAQTMEEEGMRFEAAAEAVRERALFTTHTPVAAGHDRFPADRIERLLGPLRERLGLSPEALIGLGRVNPNDPHEPFCMTVLALRLSARANAVSALHARTSRAMWRALWPHAGVAGAGGHGASAGAAPGSAAPAASAAPIGHVTNGVHVPTWVAPEMAEFLSRHLGAGWQARLCHADLWDQLHRARPADLWEVKRRLKRVMLDFVERRGRARRDRLGGAPAPGSLQADALTIGVARRFVEYKRANLLFADPERLGRLLSNPARPAQILFAGKAHPHDEMGKAMLRAVHEYSLDARFRGRIVLLEDHDMNVGRHLVQGCDLWLNMPRRPLEACGTSGQKGIFNATLNLSVLDGWWAEAFDGGNGYAFGEGLTHSDPALHDRRDAEQLYAALETAVIPDFYDRGADGVPERWVARVIRAFATLAWRYNSDRMAMDYVTHAYLPASASLTSSFPPSGP